MSVLLVDAAKIHGDPGSSSAPDSRQKIVHVMKKLSLQFFSSKNVGKHTCFAMFTFSRHKGSYFDTKFPIQKTSRV